MLNTFELDYLAFEIRYPNAYRIWDAAGSIAEAFADEYKSSLVLSKAEPNLISYVINRRFVIEVRLDRLNILDHRPIAEFGKNTEDLNFIVSVVSGVLALNQITRLGTRFVYKREFKDRNQMSGYFEQFEFSRAVSSRNFNVEPTRILPSLYLQVEDDELGYHFRFSAKSEKISFDLGPSVRNIEPVDQEKFYAAIDVDLYTVGMLDMETLRVPDWMERASRAVRRDVDKILSNLEVL